MSPPEKRLSLHLKVLSGKTSRKKYFVLLTFLGLLRRTIKRPQRKKNPESEDPGVFGKAPAAKENPRSEDPGVFSKAPAAKENPRSLDLGVFSKAPAAKENPRSLDLGFSVKSGGADGT